MPLQTVLLVSDLYDAHRRAVSIRAWVRGILSGPHTDADVFRVLGLKTFSSNVASVRCGARPSASRYETNVFLCLLGGLQDIGLMFCSPPFLSGGFFSIVYRSIVC